METTQRQPAWGESPEHAWTAEFLERCFPESAGRVNADMNLAMAMCKAEPKHAQVAMQLLAQEIRARSAEDTGIPFLRFALGALFLSYVGLAYAEGRCPEGEVPQELHVPMQGNPEILECANGIGDF